LLGIDVVPVVSVAFVVAGALATVAGWLLVPLTSANVFVGERLALLGFVAMALGGFGSFRGAIVGGLLVGLLTGVGPIFVATLAIGLNFAFGYGGQLVLGQPVVFAAAAYTAGLLSSKLSWEIWQTFLPGILAAVATGLLLALPSVRIRGWYLGIISFFAIAVM